MPTQIVVAIDDQSNIDAWGLRPYGTWSAGTYPKGAVVSHSGSLWIANANVSGTPGIDASWGVLVPSVVGATGAMFPQGNWNASTNVPALASGVGTEGYIYRVSTAGTTALDGISSWNSGDFAFYVSGGWRKIRGQTVNAADIANSSAVGRTLLTAADAAAQRSALGFTWNYPGGALPSYVWMSSDGSDNRPYPIGVAANQIAYINANSLLEIKRPAANANYSFVSSSVGLSNYAGFYHDASNRQFMVLSKSDGSLGTRFQSDGDGNYVDSRLAYFARAWVSFNGTGTVAINASGNVSSITDNGVGDYTINFTNAMPDANYAIAGGGKLDSTNTDVNTPIIGLRRSSGNPSTSSVRIVTYAPGVGAFDCETVTVAIFR